MTSNKSASSTPPTRRKRPHTKSRRGCLNCKARKVKCQETQPACANCIGRDMECVYPSTIEGQLVVRRRPNGEIRSQGTENESHSPAPLQSRTIGLLPIETFTPNDLRFFHHFLLVAHPHLPFGGEDLWKTEVPVHAHQCSHLMHAILSLGATHLSSITPNGAEYTPSAIVHRGKALKALGEILAKGDRCTDIELDGILATCYTLVFQANYMNDGLVDFAVMVRGCGLITTRIVEKYKKSKMFTLQTPDEMALQVCPRLSSEPYGDTDTLETSIQNLDSLRPLLQSSAHHHFFNALRNTYAALQRSAREAFLGVVNTFAVWYNLDNQEFLTFIAPGNYVSKLLFLHFIAQQIMMRPLFMILRPQSMMEFPSDTMAVHQWAERVYEDLPSSMRELVEWPAHLITLDKAFVSSETGTGSSLRCFCSGSGIVRKVTKSNEGRESQRESPRDQIEDSLLF